MRLGPAALLLTAALVSAAFPAAMQAYKSPRTPDGQPDLQGIWSNAVITPLERPAELKNRAFLTEQEARDYEKRVVARNNTDTRDSVGTEADVTLGYNDFWWDRGTKVVGTRRTSLIVDPPDGRIPALTPLARRRQQERGERQQEHPADGPEDRPLGERCIVINSAGPPMSPSAYNNNYQIVQSADHVVILNEMVHEARVIPLDGRPHLPGSVRQILGDSVGHWEGETLVVDTTNFTGQTAYRGSGENLHLTERFTRMDAETLLYEYTVDDPESFIRPWSVALPSTRVAGPIFEYACNEGNLSMVGLLSAARAEEREAAAKK